MISRPFSISILIAFSLAGVVGNAAGIFTLRGKVKSFNDSTYEIQTKAMVYEIRKSGLSESQLAELKNKKTGQDVELVVTTEAVVKVRDVVK